MKIAVAGASGLIGGALVPALRADGHEVLRLVRRTPRTADEHRWDPQHRRIDPAPAERRRRGDQPRRRPDPPASLDPRLPARAGDQPARRDGDDQPGARRRGDRRPVPAAGAAQRLGGRLLRRHGRPASRRGRPAGRGLPRPAVRRSGRRPRPRPPTAGVRVVLLRTGLVLGPGAMLVRSWARSSGSGWAAGSGSGRQYWPWIGLDDEIGAIRHLLTADVSGPVNLTAPDPVTNARVHPRPRPGAAPAHPRCRCPPSRSPWRSASSAGPASSVGQQALPAKLLDSGYVFTDTDLEATLRKALPAAADRAAQPRRWALSSRHPSGARTRTMRDRG